MRKKRIKFFGVNAIILLFLAVTLGNNVAYGVDNIPKVEKIIYEYGKVYEGDTQTIDILSKSISKVQYRVWISNKSTGKWEDITNGFSDVMGENQIFTVTTPELSKGDYTVSVWIRRAGVKPLNARGYDTFFVSSMKCTEWNGQAFSTKLNTIKNNYAKGEAIELKKEEGMEQLYKANIYNTLKNQAIVHHDKEYKESLSWSSNTDGIYLVKLNLKSTKKVEVPKETLVDDKESEVENKETLNEENLIEEKVPEEDSKEEVNEASSKETSKDTLEEKTESTLGEGTETEQQEEEAEEKIEDKDSENNEVQYKEFTTEEEITKLIIVGNPDRGHKKEETSKTPSAPAINSLVVGKVGETSKVYIKAEPKSNSRNIGYIYGSLHGMKVLKKVGSYYYVETTSYGTSNNIRGYIPISNVKIVKPNESYSILVDLSDQHVYVYKDGKLIRNIICSTGQDWTPTPTGTFMTGDKGPSFLTGSNNSIICYNWVRFNNNYLFHSILYDRNGQPIQSEAAKLGSKASHGCIRMPMEDIKWFYTNVPRGTGVVIQK